MGVEFGSVRDHERIYSEPEVDRDTKLWWKETIMT